MNYEVTPVEWELAYNVQPPTPIARVRLHHNHYRAWRGDEDLGSHPTGDDAAWAIWRRFCDQSTVRLSKRQSRMAGRGDTQNDT